MANCRQKYLHGGEGFGWERWSQGQCLTVLLELCSRGGDLLKHKETPKKRLWVYVDSISDIFLHHGSNFILHSTLSAFQQHVRLWLVVDCLLLSRQLLAFIYVWHKLDTAILGGGKKSLTVSSTAFTFSVKLLLFSHGRVYFAAHFLLLQAGRSRMHPRVGYWGSSLIISLCETSLYSCLWSFIYRARGMRRRLAARFRTLSPRAPKGAWIDNTNTAKSLILYDWRQLK